MGFKHFALLLMAVPKIALSQTHDGSHGSTLSAYAGEEIRLIKSLSEQDLEEIARGGGWGLARAAELNGVPGPTHLLELADEIGLTEQQRSDIEAIRAQMQTDAIAAGQRFVAAERALDAAFQHGAPDAEALEQLVAEAGQARAALRFVHLNAHLLTLPLLTDAQVSQYSVLRGYGSVSASTFKSAQPCIVNATRKIRINRLRIKYRLTVEYRRFCVTATIERMPWRTIRKFMIPGKNPVITLSVA